jgi:biotin carboxyl carrier protein
VRVDSGFVAGDVVPGEFDSMLAKVIGVGPTRAEAIARLEEALARSTVAIEGGASNRALLLELLAHDDVRNARITTRWLDGHLTRRGGAHSRPNLDGALVAAAVREYQRARDEERAEVFRRAQRGMPQGVPQPEARAARFDVDGATATLEVRAMGPDRYRVTCQGESVEVTWRTTGPCTALLTLRGRRLPVVEVMTPTALHVECDGVAHRFARASDGRVVAPVPAAVTELRVREGDTVQAGDRLLTLEVMKMELAVTAPVAGRVGRVLVEAAARVTAGQCLVVIEGGAGCEAAAAPSLSPLVSDLPDDPHRADAALRLAAMLGYDVSPPEMDEAAARLRDGKRRITRAELATLLDAYVSHEALFDPARGDDGAAAVDHLARALLPAPLRHEGVPERFVADLREALRWHDVRDHEPDARRDDALLRVLQAHGALEARDRLMMAALHAVMRDDGGDAAERERTALRARCEAFAARVVKRDRALSEAAFTVLYQLCERPRQRAEVAELTRAAGRCFARLVAAEVDDDARARVEAELDELPQGALLSLVHAAPDLDQPAARDALLDLLVRRMHPGAARAQSLDAGVAAAVYVTGRDPVLALLSTAPRAAEDTLVAHRLDGAAREVEVFVPEPDAAWQHDGSDATALGLVELSESVARVSVNWGSAELGRLSRTFTRGEDGAFREDRFFRDLHPARVEMGEIARLAAFDLERLPAPGEVFLAVARAKSDPSDERLVCVVEAERIDPARDPGTGALRYVPGFERVFLTAIHAMREAQSLRAREPRPSGIASSSTPAPCSPSPARR